MFSYVLVGAPRCHSYLCIFQNRPSFHTRIENTSQNIGVQRIEVTDIAEKQVVGSRRGEGGGKKVDFRDLRRKKNLFDTKVALGPGES